MATAKQACVHCNRLKRNPATVHLPTVMASMTLTCSQLELVAGEFVHPDLQPKIMVCGVVTILNKPYLDFSESIICAASFA